MSNTNINTNAITKRLCLTAGIVAAPLIGMLVGSPAVAAADAAAPVNGDGAPALAAVDTLVQAYLDDEDLAGATVAITKGSRLVWSKGYGYADPADDVEMQPEHRTYIGSTSKVITAIAAMQLVEDGGLDLDQHVYGSLSPLWGSEWGTTPGAVVGSGGALEQPGDYATALIGGVDALGEQFPPAEHVDELPSLPWALLLQASYEQEVETTLARASTVRVRHVLSHTAGYLNSAAAAKQGAVDHFGVSLDDVTAAQYHQAVLLGTAGAPFRSDPGTDEEYSNHSFSVAGLLIEEASGEGSYRSYVEQHVLDPLGLTDVVPNNAELGALDAVPHSSSGTALEVDPTTISRLGLSTGGWTASARDLARIICSIDQSANNLRSLEPASVVEMASDAAPGASGVNPLGWDSSASTELTKNGSISGGASRISKFLPGAFDATDDEINVAVAVNQDGAVPSTTLLRSLAQVAADAAVPSSDDLFDPAHRCHTEPGFTTGERVPADEPDPTGDMVIRGPLVDPTDVRTLETAGRPCDQARPVAVTAHVAATSALRSVELTWQVGDSIPSAPVEMQTADERRFVAELGPFDTTITPVGSSAPLIVTVTATDDTGTVASTDQTITLVRCDLRMQS